MDDQTLEMLAQLSRIHLADSEKEQLKENLARVLHYVEQLKEVDVEGIPPCHHVIADAVNVMREDEVEESEMTLDDLLHNAPDSEGTSLRVPAILKGGS